MFRRTHCILLTLGVALFAWGCSKPADSGDSGSKPTGDGSGKTAMKIDFETEIKPVLQTYCMPCHGGAGKGGVSLDALATNDQAAANSGILQKMAGAIEGGKMPPATGKPIPDDVKAKLIADLKAASS
ncbi:MAG TPA: hypothetical protein PLH94_06800 [Fimbriimonadaceae bacterium]|nr:hypothetical protein [Fimbriimonadaceae bacterium]